MPSMEPDSDPSSLVIPTPSAGDSTCKPTPASICSCSLSTGLPLASHTKTLNAVVPPPTNVEFTRRNVMDPALDASVLSFRLDPARNGVDVGVGRAEFCVGVLVSVGGPGFGVSTTGAVVGDASTTAADPLF